MAKDSEDIPKELGTPNADGSDVCNSSYKKVMTKLLKELVVVVAMLCTLGN